MAQRNNTDVAKSTSHSLLNSLLKRPLEKKIVPSGSILIPISSLNTSVNSPIPARDGPHLMPSQSLPQREGSRHTAHVGKTSSQQNYTLLPASHNATSTSKVTLMQHHQIPVTARQSTPRFILPKGAPTSGNPSQSSVCDLASNASLKFQTKNVAGPLFIRDKGGNFVIIKQETLQMTDRNNISTQVGIGCTPIPEKSILEPCEHPAGSPQKTPTQDPQIPLVKNILPKVNTSIDISSAAINSSVVAKPQILVLNQHLRTVSGEKLKVHLGDSKKLKLVTFSDPNVVRSVESSTSYQSNTNVTKNLNTLNQLAVDDFNTGDPNVNLARPESTSSCADSVATEHADGEQLMKAGPQWFWETVCDNDRDEDSPKANDSGSVIDEKESKYSETWSQNEEMGHPVDEKDENLSKDHPRESIKIGFKFAKIGPDPIETERGIQSTSTTAEIRQSVDEAVFVDELKVEDDLTRENSDDGVKSLIRHKTTNMDVTPLKVTKSCIIRIEKCDAPSKKSQVCADDSGSRSKRSQSYSYGDDVSDVINEQESDGLIEQPCEKSKEELSPEAISLSNEGEDSPCHVKTEQDQITEFPESDDKSCLGKQSVCNSSVNAQQLVSEVDSADLSQEYLPNSQYSNIPERSSVVAAMTRNFKTYMQHWHLVRTEHAERDIYLYSSYLPCPFCLYCTLQEPNHVCEVEKASPGISYVFKNPFLVDDTKNHLQLILLSPFNLNSEQKKHVYHVLGYSSLSRDDKYDPLILAFCYFHLPLMFRKKRNSWIFRTMKSSVENLKLVLKELQEFALNNSLLEDFLQARHLNKLKDVLLKFYDDDVSSFDDRNSRKITISRNTMKTILILCCQLLRGKAVRENDPGSFISLTDFMEALSRPLINEIVPNFYDHVKFAREERDHIVELTTLLSKSISHATFAALSMQIMSRTILFNGFDPQPHFLEKFLASYEEFVMFGNLKTNRDIELQLEAMKRSKYCTCTKNANDPKLSSAETFHNILSKRLPMMPVPGCTSCHLLLPPDVTTALKTLLHVKNSLKINIKKPYLMTPNGTPMTTYDVMETIRKRPNSTFLNKILSDELRHTTSVIFQLQEFNKKEVDVLYNLGTKNLLHLPHVVAHSLQERRKVIMEVLNHACVTKTHHDTPAKLRMRQLLCSWAEFKKDLLWEQRRKNSDLTKNSGGQKENSDCESESSGGENADSCGESEHLVDESRESVDQSEDSEAQGDNLSNQKRRFSGQNENSGGSTKILGGQSKDSQGRSKNSGCQSENSDEMIMECESENDQLSSIVDNIQTSGDETKKDTGGQSKKGRKDHLSSTMDRRPRISVDLQFLDDDDWGTNADADTSDMEWKPSDSSDEASFSAEASSSDYDTDSRRRNRRRVTDNNKKRQRSSSTSTSSERSPRDKKLCGSTDVRHRKSHIRVSEEDSLFTNDLGDEDLIFASDVEDEDSCRHDVTNLVNILNAVDNDRENAIASVASDDDACNEVDDPVNSTTSSDNPKLLSQTEHRDPRESQSGDTVNAAPKLDESRILRDRNNPKIYIRKVLKSTVKKHPLKKSDRVYNSVHACWYCEKLVLHIRRHIQLKHRKEEKVAELLKMANSYDKYSEQVADVSYNLLRAAGDDKHNCKVISDGAGELLLSRRPSHRLDCRKYVPCPKCREWICTSVVSRHKLHCKSMGQLKLGNEKLQFQPNIMFKSGASNLLRGEVFTSMPNDEISQIAQNDPLIVMLGESWLRRNITHSKRKHYACEHMRLAAKLLEHLRATVPTSCETTRPLWDFLIPEYFDYVTEAALEIRLPDADDKEEPKSPSIAIKLKYDVIRMVNAKWAYITKNGGANSEKKLCTDFLDLIKVHWSKKVTGLSQAVLDKRPVQNSNELMPDPKDIADVVSHLKSNMKVVQEKKDFHLIAMFVQARLQIYNRRQNGEIDTVTLENYAYRQKYSKDIDQTFAGELSELEKYILVTQELMTVRGENGRPVPILLPEDTSEALAYLADPDVRAESGIRKENNYLFATAGDSPLDSYESVKTICSESSLKVPEKITSINLRNYIGTLSQVLDLSKPQLDWLCHTKQIHVDGNMQKTDLLERTEVAKILLMQDMRIEGRFVGKKTSEISIKDIINQNEALPTPTSEEVNDDYEDDDDDGLFDETNILRDRSCPDIYIRKIQTSEKTLNGRKKKHNRTHTAYQCCYYCKRFKSNFSQHCVRKHRKEPAVVDILETADTREAYRKWAVLRNKGNHENNLRTLRNGKGEMVLHRRPTQFRLKQYAPCPHCLSWLAKRLRRNHQRSCPSRMKDDPMLKSSATITQSDAALETIEPVPVVSERSVNEVDGVDSVNMDDPMLKSSATVTQSDAVLETIEPVPAISERSVDEVDGVESVDKDDDANEYEPAEPIARKVDTKRKWTQDIVNSTVHAVSADNTKNDDHRLNSDDLMSESDQDSPASKKVKHRKVHWTQTETEEIKKHFSHFLSSKTTPGQRECRRVIRLSRSNGGELCRRTPPLIIKKISNMNRQSKIEDSNSDDDLDVDLTFHPSSERAAPTSKKMMGKRVKWTQIEIEEIQKHFSHFLTSKTTPGKEFCQRVIRRSRADGGQLCRRTPPLIIKKISYLNHLHKKSKIDPVDDRD